MWILRAAVCLAVPVLIAAECKPKTKDDPAPFLPNDSKAQAVAVWMEVTLSQPKVTYVVREVYDKSTNRSFLEYYDGANFQKVLFDRKNGLFFTYTDSSCEERLQSNRTKNFFTRTELFRDLGIEGASKQGFLGPASIFDAFSADSTTDFQQTAQCDIDTDRLIPCVQWETCQGAESKKKTYYYSKEGYALFDQTNSRPLRHKTASGVIIEVLSIKTYTSSQDLFIPTGLSCANPKEVGVAVPLDTGRRAFVGEVVMNVDTIDKVLVSKLEGLVIPSDHGHDGHDHGEDVVHPGIYMFTLSTFRTNADGNLVAGGDQQIIHDVDHRVVYARYTRDDSDDIALKEIKCDISTDTDFEMELEFPTYGTIQLRPILLEAARDGVDGAMVSHLGPNKVGDLATDVYEVTYVDMRTGNNVRLNRLVVSHHFSTETELIAAIEINGFNRSDAKIFSGTIYINKYDTKLTKLNEKLRVDDCPAYQDNSESRWLQIGFEVASTGIVAQIMESGGTIRDAFVDKLMEDYDVSPMRLPQINVDFVDQEVLVTALILERPLVETAYEDSLRRDFIKPTRVLGVMSLSRCQITCLGMNEQECTAISYCGATCSISGDPNPASAARSTNSDSCLLFERGLDHEISVTSTILRSLQNDITTPATENSLRLRFKAGDDSREETKVVEITALTYDDTKSYDNAFHFDKDKVAIVETSFTLALAKRRYKTNAKASLLGSLVLEDCALACKNRKNCEVFTYCMNSMECMISANHAINPDEVEEDNECVAYQKKYLDRFEKYPGVTIMADGENTAVTSEETCAQQCVNREDECKSFEYCDSTGACVLLKTHIADSKTVQKKEKTAEGPECSHYSKRFLYDYSVLSKKRGNGDETTELAQYVNVTQASCAKLCSEWGDSNSTCLSFDFCAPEADNTGQCTLRTVDGKDPTDSPTCNFLYLTVASDVGTVKHGSGEAVGLSLLMILIGAGLAVGGLFLYNKYR